MKLEEQYLNLMELKKEINVKLMELNKDRLKDIILDFFRPGSLKKLFLKDNQLFMLHCFCTVWMEEQKILVPLHVEQDIFEGIHSLEDVEEKYLSLKFGVLRMEQSMPYEYCAQAVDYFTERHISGIALHYIIKNETWKRESNMVILAKLLKERGEYLSAVILLQEAEKTFPGNKNILMELSDCWLTARVFGEAKKCLLKIVKPDKKIRNLITELEKIEECEVV